MADGGRAAAGRARLRRVLPPSRGRHHDPHPAGPRRRPRPATWWRSFASADAFCHSMVRSLVGALIAVGEGRRPPEWPAALFARTERSSEVPVAPAGGLTLVRVDYPVGRGAGRPRAGHPRPAGLTVSRGRGADGASRPGVAPPTSSRTAPSRSASSRATSTAATSSRGTLPWSTDRRSVTRPVPGSSVRRARPQHRRPQARPGEDVLLGRQLGLQVGHEDVVQAVGPGAVGDGLDAHRRDQQVAPHPRALGGVGEQDGGRRGRRCPCGRPRCPARHRRRRRRRPRRSPTAATSSTDAVSRSRTAGSTPSAAGRTRARGCGRCRRRSRRGRTAGGRGGGRSARGRRRGRCAWRTPYPARAVRNGEPDHPGTR